MNIFPQDIFGRYKNLKHFLISVGEVIKAGYPARNLKVIGVTGTDGKTTIVHLIAAILKKAGYKTAFLSTIGAFVDGEKTDTGLHTTTPDATVLQPLLKKWCEDKVEYAVLEVTSHGLDQHRVVGANFLMGVLTNVTHEHLDYHKTFENYRRTKAKLFRGVGLAVINKDDPSFVYFQKATKRGKIISYGIKNTATLTATEIRSTPQGMNFSVKEKGKLVSLKTSLLGEYNVYNILAACVATRAVGVSWSVIKKAVGDFKDVEGRMQEIPNKRRIKIIVDFAHTPASLENLLETLKKLKAKSSKLIAVFGCAGERDKLKRPIMGRVSTKLADISIFTAEDPRSEDVNKIIDQMIDGAKKTNAQELRPKVSYLNHPRGGSISTPWEDHIYIREPNRKRAIKLALLFAQKNDVVVVCGKGHEKSMAFGKKELPWSDMQVVEEALKQSKHEGAKLVHSSPVKN